MTTKLVFLFPGQGSQATGMGRTLAQEFPSARRTFEEADDALGFALSRLCLEGPEDQLRMTEFAQPAILTVSVAASRVLAERGAYPDFVAGHSLGEYSADVAAGVIPFPDAVRAVRSRGRFMQEAVPAGQGAMAAVLGLSPDETVRACADVAAAGGVVAAANFNSPTQTVISGAKTPVEQAGTLAKERGAKRVVPLAVSAPFHCTLMQPAQDRLSTLLGALTFSDARIPVAVNVDAKLLTTGNLLHDALVRQVTGAVRWVESMQLLIRAASAEGPAEFVEIGPGKVLCGLMRQIDRTQKCVHVSEFLHGAAALPPTL